MPKPVRMRKSVLGTVYFVGAGPGDPKLITQKGAELLAQADCVLYDRLVDPKLLTLTSPRCERIYVGKRSDEAGGGQRTINRLLVEKARQHRMVVRLKGGDPTLFGRITEELESLVAVKIPFEIVPGVSSAWAAAAHAGIPLTDRAFSSSVAFVTGQEASGKRPSVRWGKLAQSVDTIVIMMGRTKLPQIVQRLIRGGLSPSTPIALIRSVATPYEQILLTTLGKAEADLKRRAEFGPPVVAVIGRVVKHSRRFRSAQLKPPVKPLLGKRILITRPVADSADLSARLKELGAQCVHLATISIKPRALSEAERKELLAELPQAHWILFTSHHGVGALERLASQNGWRLKRLIRGKICAIGPRTQAAVKQAGLRVDLLPGEFSTDGIQRAFEPIPVARKRILIPRSNLGRGDKLARSLRRCGAEVKERILYETRPTALAVARVKRALKNLDVLTFTSASTVYRFFEAVRRTGISSRATFNGAKVVAIGPKTKEALEKAGISKVFLPPGSWTIEGMVQAIQEACSCLPRWQAGGRQAYR